MKITIVGAGFSGLTLARDLVRRGFQVEVLDRENRAGGLIGTRKTEYGLAETAAPSLTRSRRLDELFAELGLEARIPAKAASRRLFYVGRLTTWPLSIFQSIALGLNAIFSKLTGTLQPVTHETVAQWGRRTLTAKAVQNLLAPGLQGIYAGDVEKMSASLILGSLFKKGREKFKGVVGVPGGTLGLIQALEENLKAKGVVFRYGVNISPDQLPTPAVIATSAADAGRLMAVKYPEVATRLAQIQMSPLLSVTVFYDEPTGPRAFGCVVPRGQGVRVLGVLLNHAIFPGRDIKFSETWIFAGATDPNILSLSDQELKELIAKERKVIFGKDDRALHHEFVRWQEGLPHYNLVLESVLKDLPEPPSIWFHGNWLGGIGLSKILDRSETLAERIAKELQ